MHAEWVAITEVEDVPRRVDSIEECTCCQDKYPWALLTMKIDAQNRVLILCSLCDGKIDG